jgi:biopolymer transport protein ExbD
MGMNVGGSGRRAEINVTPLIDVLLVLIIIFLVITPSNSHGLRALTPPQSDVPDSRSTVSHEIVITLGKDGAVEINSQPVGLDQLASRLTELRGMSDHVFVRGDGQLEFQAVAQVIDIARGAGWDRIGLMTR